MIYLLDSDVMLHYFENKEHTKSVENLFDKINRGQFKAIISNEAIQAVKEAFLLKNLIEELNRFYESITELSNLSVYYLSVDEEKYIIQIMYKFRINYLQALHYYICKKHNIKLISFNDVYKTIPDIKLIQP
jgi:predicted nucleic acid-binding protein